METLVRTEKPCSACKQVKPLDQFHWVNGSRWQGPQSRCKECNRIASKNWHSTNPERAAELVRKAHLKNTYGISVEKYAELLVAQNGACATCFKPCRIKKNLSVDHDHTSGKIRGLLCQGCNISIGHALEDAALLRRLADYLDNQPMN